MLAMVPVMSAAAARSRKSSSTSPRWLTMAASSRAAMTN